MKQMIQQRVAEAKTEDDQELFKVVMHGKDNANVRTGGKNRFKTTDDFNEYLHEAATFAPNGPRIFNDHSLVSHSSEDVEVKVCESVEIVVATGPNRRIPREDFDKIVADHKKAMNNPEQHVCSAGRTVPEAGCRQHP